MSIAKTTFYVQFKRTGSGVVASAVTQNPPRVPRGARAGVFLKVRASIPMWVFDPLDLVADLEISGEAVQPLIRLEAIGPVIPEEPTDA